MQHFKQYINGQFEEGSEHFESLNPATGQPWASFPAATEADVNRAVDAAETALYSGLWSTMTATQRGKLLRTLADLISEHATELGDLETTDSGKLAKETRMQTGYVADYYLYYAGLADKIQGDVIPIDKPDLHVYTTREPIGVVAAVVPWNAQMFLAATKIAPALAAGNTVVVKETARHIIQNSSENFAHVSLELGGKSPILVFDDADLEGAVNGIIAGNYGASGQSCVAGSRVFIQSGIFDQVLAKIKERAAQIIIGDPLDDQTQVGPLATTAQLERCERVIANSVAQGAELICGGQRPTHLDTGWYFEPTLLACPDQSIESVQTEFFAPVISALRFETEAEAIALANDTRFGLAAGVFTENLARAHRVTKQIRAGILYVNTYRVISPLAPFGGFKQSGGNREAGMDVIYDYTRTKTTWINTSEQPMANPFVMR